MYLIKAPASPGPHPLLIICHGYGQRPASLLRFAQLWASEWVIASLQGPYPQYRKSSDRPSGYGWIDHSAPERSQEIHCEALAAVIDELTAKGVVDPQRVVLAGFSQSVSLNYRFAFKKLRPLAGLIAIMGGLPGNIDELEVEYTAPTLVIGAEEDIHYPPEVTKGFISKLKNLKIPVRELWYKYHHELPLSLDADIKSWLDDL